MKWAVTINLAKIRNKLRHVFALSRTYLLLTLCSMLFFIALGIGGVLQTHFSASPVSSMKGLASSLSSRFFADMIGLEMPHLPRQEASELSQQNVFRFLFQYVTNINPADPKSLLARELPGLRGENPVLLSKGGSAEPIAPTEYMPSPDTWKNGKDGEKPDGGEKANDGMPSPNVTPTASDRGTEQKGDPAGKSADEPSKDEPAPETDSQKKPSSKAILIYHSHNRESFFPELPKQTKYAEDDKINITLVGKRLREKLEEYGIGAIHSDKDYASTVKGYDWSYSYKYSEQTVKEAVAANPDLTFFFDLHRDSQSRKHTTAKINGKDYAQVYFIIGQRNPHWNKNYEFAKKLNDLLEEKYPGITRGVWNKSVNSGHGEYNQSISPNSVLIEIGGVDNTLEETYRTADALAKIIAELYLDAEEVSGKAQ
jgi:stage II sporulation protein P